MSSLNVFKKAFVLNAIITCIILCFQTNILYAQKTFPPVISETVSDVTETSLGSIQLSVSGGTAPYTYLWNTGSTADRIDNCTAGKYSVTVEDANRQTVVKSIYVQASIEWTRFLNASSDGSYIEKENQSSDAWNSGAAGHAYFESSDDGMMSYVTDAQSTHRFMGLAVPGNNMAWNSLSYSIYFMPGNALKIYESGVYAGSFGTYTAGDEFSIVKEGNTIKYYHGSNLMRTKTITTPTVLVPQIELYTKTAHFDEIKTSASKFINLSAQITDVSLSDLGSINLTASGASQPYIYEWNTGATTHILDNCNPGKYTVTVTDNIGMTNIKDVYVHAPLYWGTFLNATSEGVLVKKTGSASNWDASASSMSHFEINEDGMISHVTDAQNTYRFMGLAVPGNNMAWNSLSYSFYFMTNNKLRIYELGVFAGDFGSFTPGEEFSIVKEGDKIKYYRGDQLLRTAIITTPSILVPQVQLYYPTSHFDEIKSSAVNSIVPIQVTENRTPLSGSDLGSISLNVSKGIPSYTYQWSTGATTPNINNVGVGEYAVTITDDRNIEHVEHLNLGYFPEFEENEKCTYEYNASASTISPSYMDANITFDDKFIFSKNKLAVNTNGFIYFRFKSGDFGQYNVGLVSGQKLPSEKHIDYGFRVNNRELIYNGETMVEIVEHGVVKASFTNFKENDELKIKRSNGLIQYYNGGTLLREVFATSDAYYLAAAIENTGIQIQSLGCSFAYTAPTADYFNPLTDPSTDWNTTSQLSYDEDGQIVSASRLFVDDFGRNIQTQVLNPEKNKIMGSQVIFGIKGRAVLNTLTVPVFTNNFEYQDGFITTGGSNYYSFDFDLPFNRYNPDEVDASSPLGHYYSENNIDEPYVPITSYPYTRTEFSEIDDDVAIKTTAAGEAYKLGSGHEVKTYSMQASNLMEYLFGLKEGYHTTYEDYIYEASSYSYEGWHVDFDNSENSAYVETGIAPREDYKTIAVDSDGKTSIVFYDREGKKIATAVSGYDNGKIREVTCFPEKIINRWVTDFHLPASLGDNQEVRVMGPIPTIIDLETGETVDNTNTVPPTAVDEAAVVRYGYGTDQVRVVVLPPGFYRMDAAKLIQYKTDYSDFTLYQYNKSGQLMDVIPPKAIDEGYLYLDESISTSHPVQEVKSGFTSTGELINNNGNINELSIVLQATPANTKRKTFVKVSFGDFVNGAKSNASQSEFFTSMIGPSGGDDSDYDDYDPIDYYRGNNLIKIEYRLKFYDTEDVELTDLAVDDDFYFEIQHMSLSANQVYKDMQKNFVFDEIDDVHKIKLIVDQIDISSLSINGTNQSSHLWRRGFTNWASSDVNLYDGVYTSALFCENTSTKVFHEQENSQTGAMDVEECVQDFEILYDTYPDPNGTGDLGYDFSIYSVGPTVGKQISFAVDYFDITSDKDHGTEPTHNTELTESYTYNHRGLLKTSKTADAGLTEFVYRKDGKVRYSQNALQKLNNTFSYVNYDKMGRTVETGEFVGTSLSFTTDKYMPGTSTATGMYSSLERVFVNAQSMEDVYGAGTTENESYSLYDKEDSDGIIAEGFDAVLYQQSYVQGAVSKTWNEHHTTWYSYDASGQLEWTIQKPKLMAAKTTHYEYDYLGHITKSIYQKDQMQERLDHIYSYNKNGQIKELRTYTYRDVIHNTEVVVSGNIQNTHQASYSYYTHGPVKRVEINNETGVPLQGIDYLYTVNGKLKSINHPMLSEEVLAGVKFDPGQDANDLFGMNFDYYPSDYIRENTYVDYPENGKGYYNGNIFSVNWNTAYSQLSNDISLPADKKYWAVVYQYNHKNWLTSALLGSKDVNDHVNDNQWAYGYPSSANTFVQNPDLAYQLSGLTYDANGNLLSLQRNGYGAAINMDALTYEYFPNSNQLKSVSDAFGAQLNSVSSQAESNQYDVLGQMTFNKQDGVEMTYYSDGLISEARVDDYVKRYYYDERGFKNYEIVYQGNPQDGLQIMEEWYIRDLSGNLLSTYRKMTPTVPGLEGIQLYEQPLYASSRIGILKNDNYIYEHTDHLGNLRATYQRATDGSAQLLSYADYYPFGWEMPGRTYNIDNNRYAYQGQFAEKDAVTGYNHFQLREWDSRLGRWMSTDPYAQFHSPYLGMGNNPIGGVDPDGGFFDDIFYNSKTDKAIIIKTDHDYDRTFVDGEFIGETHQRSWYFRYRRIDVHNSYLDYYKSIPDLGRKLYQDDDLFRHLMNSWGDSKESAYLFNARYQYDLKKNSQIMGVVIASPFVVIAAAELTAAYGMNAIYQGYRAYKIGKKIHDGIKTKATDYTVKGNLKINELKRGAIKNYMSPKVWEKLPYSAKKQLLKEYNYFGPGTLENMQKIYTFYKRYL